MTTTEPPSTHPIPALRRPGNVRTLTHACLALLLAALPAILKAQSPSTPPGWALTWSDEFNGPNGSSPDPAKWTYDIGGGGYGNHELESYTNRPDNVRQQDGHLLITALKETHTGPDGITRHYTSARILTKGLFSQPYGRFEARIKLPTGKGIWPAFWLLGSNIDSDPWPKSGEIDIMENIGNPTEVHSTLHGPGYSGGNPITAKFTLPTGEAVNTAFHLYSVEWTPNDIKFFIDDHLITHRTPADLPPGTHWVFDHPFFIILNLATGGSWPGNPDQTTTFPQQMVVDYVRVYKPNQTKPSQTPIAAATPKPLQ
ncbi:glycoside hydrolase family 16 protein [Tunturiibacter gelidiferens]|uniref:glycoside hydrolase family 16 protein n=1 Tax=Tunturiibacter gelidiferens TaxID=3069689 RepID=UPI003D9AC8F9